MATLRFHAGLTKKLKPAEEYHIIYYDKEAQRYQYHSATSRSLWVYDLERAEAVKLVRRGAKALPMSELTGFGAAMAHLADAAARQYTEERMPRLYNQRTDTDIPTDAVDITRQGPWGNPFKIGPDGDRAQVLASYRAHIEGTLARQPDYLEPLRGKDLICWCHPEPCHGDVILELLSKEQPHGKAS